MNNIKSINSEFPSSLKFKRKRELFTNRMETLLEIPKAIKSKFTYSIFNDELSIPLCLKKIKPDSKPNISSFISNSPEVMSIKDRFYSDINEEISVIKDEIDEIVNELQFFARERRKKKMIKLMEQIAENFDESLIDVEELTDYYLLGNKMCNIENEYMERQRNNYRNNQIFCEYTNRLLLDDDESFNKKGNQSEDRRTLNQKEKSVQLVFMTHKTKKEKN